MLALRCIGLAGASSRTPPHARHSLVRRRFVGVSLALSPGRAAIIKGMARGRTTYVGKLVLVLLIAYGTLSSQGAWVTPGHTHRSGPEHCCGVCHAGHLPLVEPVNAFSVLPPARRDWFHSSEKRQRQQDALIVLGQSRAPPPVL